MTIEIIGAGFGRTGTHTLKLALQHLGFSKCYHMEELVMNPESLHYWEDARHGKQVNWDELFKGYRAAVDFPTNMFYTDLMQHYPDAKVILTMRDPESWYKSFGSTIIRQSKPSLKQIVSTSFKLPFNQKLRQQLKIFKYAGKFLDEMFGGRFDEDKEKMINIFNSRNDHIKNTIPPEKLLIYEVKDGWAPLCNFLVLTFSVVGIKTGGRGGNEEIVEPVVMIDATIKFMSWGGVGLTDFSSGTIRPEVMK